MRLKTNIRIIRILIALALPLFAGSFALGRMHQAFAASASNFRLTFTPGPQCFDGNDNDGDGLIDFPDDPDCDNAADTDEAAPVVVGPTPGGGGGGGGGGFSVEPSTSVSFSGYAYPGSTVFLLKDAQLTVSALAGPDAKFSLNLTGLSAGSYLFSIYGESVQGRRSSLNMFPVSLSKGSLTSISDVVIAPTIITDKAEVRQGDVITMFGESSPNADILITMTSGNEYYYQTKANADGLYAYDLSTASYAMGDYFVKAKAGLPGGLESGYCDSMTFKIGTANVPRGIVPVCGRADLNCDGRVNLVDFSIAAFWVSRPLSGDIIDRENGRLNADGKIDLVDFSIMAFYWTG